MSSKTKFKYKFIEIPLKLKYSVSSKKIGCAIVAGIIPTVFSEKITQVTIMYEDGRKAREQSTINFGYRKVNLASEIGLEINYKLTGQTEIALTPTYKQFLTSIVIDTKAKEYLYTIGVMTSIYYTFKKKS